MENVIGPAFQRHAADRPSWLVQTTLSQRSVASLKVALIASVDQSTKFVGIWSLADAPLLPVRTCVCMSFNFCFWVTRKQKKWEPENSLNSWVHLQEAKGAGLQDQQRICLISNGWCEQQHVDVDETLVSKEIWEETWPMSFAFKCLRGDQWQQIDTNAAEAMLLNKFFTMCFLATEKLFVICSKVRALFAKQAIKSMNDDQQCSLEIFSKTVVKLTRC